MSLDYSAVLADMVAAARAAGALTLDYFKRFGELEVGVKGPGDFVCEADRASETLIRDHLLSRYPGWSLTGEEFAPVEGEDPTHRWLVDPIDGTTNFLNGLPYTITIALRHGRETICGLVFDPVADEMFTALKGRGAFLNGTRLAVSRARDPRFFTVGTGLPTPELSLYPGAYARLAAIRAEIGAVRVLGSAASSCAHVACGRLSGYFEQTGFVDTAAGILLVEEAGGLVSDWWGRGPDFYERSAILIVANPAAHAFLRDHLGQAPEPDGA
ncbi:inositol monophosphatase [Jiella sp. MQZ9-1]|uniref:Inositol-1-monophosphatase n=1 Tax=Jiella flava TaxID=2816857 RepID=A0A939JTV0_9HYPH|nr:inositol monophosphatase family protein [Jiella flava]MBO0662510.1 inositol monophosphatase [Jiella flava]MCD2471735.1 inositol monophosphatase [Jiella flava]